jgi:hypothetical protein
MEPLTYAFRRPVHRGSGIRVAAKIGLIAVVVRTITACAAIPVNRIQPVIAPPQGGTCESSKMTLLDAEKSTEFHYVLPGGREPMYGATVSLSFEDYHAKVQAIVRAEMPPEPSEAEGNHCVYRLLNVGIRVSAAGRSDC